MNTIIFTHFDSTFTTLFIYLFIVHRYHSHVPESSISNAPTLIIVANLSMLYLYIENHLNTCYHFRPLPMVLESLTRNC